MSMFEFGSTVVLEGAVATGYVAPVMAWEDIPDGSGRRRPGNQQETDESGRGLSMVDFMAPLGRDGQFEKFGARVAGEVPQLAPFTPVEFDGLRVKVRQSRQGKGVDVSFAADGVRPAAPGRPARRGENGEG